MTRLALLALIFFGYTSISVAQTISCPGFGTPIKNVVYYVNGVDNSPADMRASRDALRSAVGDNSINRYDIAENRSDGAGKDFYQAYKNRVLDVDPKEFWLNVRTQNPDMTNAEIRELYADAIYSASVLEYARSDDLRNMVDGFLGDLNAGKKVVLVAHSQGNFFANAAYRFIKQGWPQYIDSIGIVAVANPAPSVEGNGLLTQNAEDFVIFGAVTSKYSVMNSNVNFKGEDPFGTDHGFLTTYMLARNARGRIASQVKQTITRLKKPISPCDSEVAMIRTRPATDTKPSSAILRADLTQGDNADVWFAITLSGNAACDAAGQANATKYTAPISISQQVNGLTPNKTYNFRACAKGTKGEIDDGGLAQLVTERNTAKIGIPSPVPGSTNTTSFEVTAQILEGVNVDVWFLIGAANARLTCNGSNFDGRGLFSAGDSANRTFTGLQSNTQYQVKACAKGSDLSSQGSPINIVATTAVPVVTCGRQAFRGANEGLAVIFNVGSIGGVSKVTFDAFDIEDSFRIYEHNTNKLLVSSNGFIRGVYSARFNVTSSFTQVDVFVTGNPTTPTAWSLIVECPIR